MAASPDFPVPELMKAWVLGDPDRLSLVDKPVPMPGRAEVLVRVDTVAICATDLEIISHGPPAMIGGGLPFNRNVTPGHEYMGTVAALDPGVDEFRIGQRVAVPTRSTSPIWSPTTSPCPASAAKAAAPPTGPSP